MVNIGNLELVCLSGDVFKRFEGRGPQLITFHALLCIDSEITSISTVSPPKATELFFMTDSAIVLIKITN